MKFMRKKFKQTPQLKMFNSLNTLNKNFMNAFTKKSKKVFFGISLLACATTPNIVNAYTPDVCKDVLGTKSATGVYSYTATQIQQNNVTFCTDTPDRFELVIYEMGLCTDNPLINTPIVFSKANCITSMTSSSGVTADLAGTTINLPSATSRPASNTYTYAYIVIKNTFGLKGSIKINNGAGGFAKYCSKGDGGSTPSSINCVPLNHTEEIESFGNNFTPDFGPENLPTGGEVSALLATPSLVRSTSEAATERLIGVFAAPVTITDSTQGLQVELEVTDGGYGIQFDSNSGVPIDFGSMPFKPIFTTF